MFRAMTRHILGGLRRAGHIACDSHATRDALVSKAGIEAERTTVVPNGPHPSCTPNGEPASDIDAARLLGVRGATVDLLHVGSTIPRKRVDILLRVMMGVLLPPEQAPSGALALVDGVEVNAGQFRTNFPYLQTPVPGATGVIP